MLDPIAPVCVWLKRDLRVTDHPALAEAAARARGGAVFGLFLFEPEVLAQPEWDSSHTEFQRECLVELEAALGRLGIRARHPPGEAVGPRGGRRVSRTAADRRRPPARVAKRLEQALGKANGGGTGSPAAEHRPRRPRVDRPAGNLRHPRLPRSRYPRRHEGPAAWGRAGGGKRARRFPRSSRPADGLREDELSPDRFAAWQTGHTGYPLVDACMRSLVATGWLTFRMRALIVSFASYSLWLHWRPSGPALPRLRARHPLVAVADAERYDGHQHAADLQRDETGGRAGSARDLHPPPIVDHALAVRGTAESRTEARDVARRHGSRRDRRGAMQQDPVRQSLAREAADHESHRPPAASDPQQLLPFLAMDAAAKN
jgi:hypothetical protein